jgi:hypothetical protein
LAQIDRRCGRKLPVEPTDLLGVDADPVALMTLLVDPATAEAVLCSHGELIGTALRQLAAGASDADSLIWPKGSTWVLELHGGQVTHRRYLPRSASTTPIGRAAEEPRMIIRRPWGSAVLPAKVGVVTLF